MFVALRCGTKLYLRPYTIDEAKQIQGFPKNYKISGIVSVLSNRLEMLYPLK